MKLELFGHEYSFEHKKPVVEPVEGEATEGAEGTAKAEPKKSKTGKIIGTLAAGGALALAGVKAVGKLTGKDSGLDDVNPIDAFCQQNPDMVNTDPSSMNGTNI